MGQQDDWLDSQLQKLAQTLAAIAGIPRDKPAEAREAVDAAFRSLTGLDARWAPALGPDGLRAIAGDDRRKTALFVEILRLDAILRREAGEPSDAQESLAEQLSGGSTR